MNLGIGSEAGPHTLSEEDIKKITPIKGCGKKVYIDQGFYDYCGNPGLIRQILCKECRDANVATGEGEEK